MTSDANLPTRSLPPWWAIVLVALAIVGVAFAIGRFTAFDRAGATPGTNSPEAGFARDMQVHHAQAVDMAMTIYRTTEDDGIRTLAYDIATAQSAQKGEFYDWLVKWGLPQSGGTPMGWMTEAGTGHAHGGDAPEQTSTLQPTDDELMAQMGMASPADLAQLSSATGTEADCLFLDLMIAHHQGAIPMGEAIAELGTDPRAIQVGEGIVATQSAEIDLMQSIQRRLGCTG